MSSHLPARSMPACLRRFACNLRSYPYLSMAASSRMSLTLSRRSPGTAQACPSQPMISRFTGEKMPSPYASVMRPQHPAFRTALTISAGAISLTMNSSLVWDAADGPTWVMNRLRELNSYFSNKSAISGLKFMSIRMSSSVVASGISVLMVTSSLDRPMWPRASSNCACRRGVSSSRWA